MANNTVGAVFEIRDRFTSGVKNITSATKSLKTNVGNATGSIKNFNTGLNTGHISNFTSKLKGLVAGYVGFSAAKGIGTAMLGEASSMEQYRNTLNVVMKDTKLAGETMVWAKDFANKTPYETSDIVNATVKLQSYGISAKNTMTSIGDMSSVMGKSMDQAVEAVADAQTGELERLKEFGITKNMIVDHANKTMNGKQIVNNKGQITDQKAFNDALFGLMNGKFKGGMEIQSKTYAGTMSTIKGVTKDALSQVAGIAGDGTVVKGGLLDQIKDGVVGLSGKIQTFVNGGGVKKIQTFVSGAFKTLGNSIKFVTDNANWLIPAVAGAVGIIGAMKVIGTVNKLMTIWKAGTLVQTATQWGLNSAMLANPLTWVVVGIGLLIAAGVALAMNWDKVKAKCGELWSNIKEKFNGIKEACSPVTDWLIEKWNSVTSVFETVKNKATELMNKIKEAWGNVKEFFGFGGDSTVTVNAHSGGGKNQHKSGLSKVPYDGYQATLHKDETVLTANQASDHRAGKSGNSKGNITIKIPKLAESIVIREEADIDKIVSKFTNSLKTEILNCV